MESSVSSKVIKTEEGMKVSGALVFTSVSTLVGQSKTYFKKHQDDSFLIDCSAMEKIDSAGIALLLEWQRQSTLNKYNCRFQGLPKQAQSLISAYHLQAVIAA